MDLESENMTMRQVRTKRSGGRAALVSVAFILLFHGCSGARVALREATPRPEHSGDPNAGTVQKAIDRTYPSLVRIVAVIPKFDGGRALKEVVSGSGVIIDPDGHVVTNYHVAGNALRLTCTLPGGQKVQAGLVGADPLTDIAVIRIGGAKGTGRWPVAVFGDSDRIQVGERVLAMGSPLSLSQSVTLGIVSNTRMTVPDTFWPFRFTVAGEEVGSLVKWIGHDALISPGSSGGPLVNLDGEIVGINEISFGLAGAIPGNVARQVAQEIIRNGRVKRSSIGVEVQPLLNLAGSARGTLVSGVVDDSDGARAGLKAGDVILSFNGQPVDVRFPEEIPSFNRLVFGTPVGTKVPVVVRRGGQEVTLWLVTEERSSAEARESVLPEWGMTASDLNSRIMREKRRPDSAGVIVRTVRPGRGIGDAKPPLRAGDVVVSVDGRKTADMESLKRQTGEILHGAEGWASALVGIDRNGERLLSVVRLTKTDDEMTGTEARKAWLGVLTQVLTRELASALKMDGRTGVRITMVIEGSSAEKAGLQVGDVITSVDGEPIKVGRQEDSEVFSAMIRRRRIDQEVELAILRGEETRIVPVVLEKSPQTGRELAVYRDEALEFGARDITFQDRLVNRWGGEVRGAVVSEVANGGWAALAHLAVGDLITKVEERDVRGVGDLEATIKESRAVKAESVVLQVRRGVHTLFVQIQLGGGNRAEED